MLRIFCAEHPRDWDDHLPYLLMTYKATEQKSTGCSPNLLFLQGEIVCPLDLMVGSPPNTLKDTGPIQYIEWDKAAMNITHEFVFKHLGVATTRQKVHYYLGLKPSSYERGE